MEPSGARSLEIAGGQHEMVPSDSAIDGAARGPEMFAQPRHVVPKPVVLPAGGEFACS
jgi:hypothetical protein